MLADKAFLELEQARERLALNQYLDNPQVPFNMNPKQPASLINAVSSTLEMESYLLPHPSKVATVDIETDSVIAGKRDLMIDMLQAMTERLDRPEKQIHRQDHQVEPILSSRNLP